MIALFELIPEGYKSRRYHKSTVRPKSHLATVIRNNFCKAFALRKLKLTKFCQINVIVSYFFHFMDIFMNEIFLWHD